MVKTSRLISILLCGAFIFNCCVYKQVYAESSQTTTPAPTKIIRKKIIQHPQNPSGQTNQNLQKNFKLGIDLSHHNTVTDWNAVKNSGVEFAIIRTSYGWEKWDKQTDKKLKEHIAGAKSVGIPIGAYHYSYATTPQEALKEADFFINKLAGTQWEYPVFIDFEDKCQVKLNNEQKTEIILTFLQKLQEAGYYTGYYTFLNWHRGNLNTKRLGGHELWIAHWNSTCDCTSPYGIWQYTSDGSVTGIDGRVDMNRCYVDYPSIIKGMHMNGF